MDTITLGQVLTGLCLIAITIAFIRGILRDHYAHRKAMIDKEIELAYAKAQPAPADCLEVEEEDDDVVIGAPTPEDLSPRYDADGMLSEGRNVSADGKPIKVEHHTARCDTLVITTDDPNYKIRKTGKIVSEDGGVIRIERGYFGTNGIDTNGQWFGTGKIDEVDASKVEQIIRVGSKIAIKCELEEVAK